MERLRSRRGRSCRRGGGRTRSGGRCCCWRRLEGRPRPSGGGGWSMSCTARGRCASSRRCCGCWPTCPSRRGYVPLAVGGGAEQRGVGPGGAGLREPLPGGPHARAGVQPDGDEGNLQRAAAGAGAGAWTERNGAELRRMVAGVRQRAAGGGATGAGRPEPDSRRIPMRLFDPAHPHDLANHRRLPGHGRRRHRRHRRAGVLGGPAAQPRGHVRGLLPVAARLGALPRLSSSASATSARWRSTPRRPTTRPSPTACWRCCARYLEKDGVVAVGEIGYDDQTDAEDRIFRRAGGAGARVRAADPDPHAPPGQEAGHRADARAGQGHGLSARADPGRSQQRGDAAADAGVGLLGRALDLPPDQDGRGADGDAGEEVRQRADHREQRGRLGGERSA